MEFLNELFGIGAVGMLARRSPGMELAFIIAGCALTALVAYILGSFNFALILSKKMYGEDIRNYGSKNAGTTNMARTYGKKAAILTIVGDILKGVVAVFIGYMLIGSVTQGGYFAGLMCVVGHIFPLFYGFRGGKGVATAAAVILVTNPLVCAVVLGVFLLTVILTRYVSLGSCLAAAIFPFMTFNFAGPGPGFLCAFLMAILVICKHYTNLYRLAHGQESKFAFKKKTDESQPEMIYSVKKKGKKYKANKKK